MLDCYPSPEICKNCTCEQVRYPGGARGYCRRCYDLIRRIKTYRNWDRRDRRTLTRIPKAGWYDYDNKLRPRSEIENLSDSDFEIYRQGHIQQIADRLRLFRYREEVSRHEFPVDGLTLEEKFAELLRLIRRKAEYPRRASYLAQHFNEQQRRIIYALLEEVIAQAPWLGIDPSLLWGKIYKIGTEQSGPQSESPSSGVRDGRESAKEDSRFRGNDVGWADGL